MKKEAYAESMDENQQTNTTTDYRKRIRNSGIAFRIKDLARKVFSIWFANARELYDLPHELLETIEDDELENAFLEHLERSIETLVEQKSDDKKSVPGWSFGFVCGYMQGSLDSKWINKYVVEPSKEYEDLMKIKALIEYLNWDDTPMEKVILFYKYFLHQRVQPTQAHTATPDNVIPISKHKGSDRIQRNELKNDIMDILSTHIEKKYLKLLKKYNYTCCPNLTEYFEVGEMKEIAGEEHFC